MPETKCCRGCGLLKPVVDFKKNRRWCIHCYNKNEAERMTEWRKQRPGEASKRVLKSREKKPDSYIRAVQRYKESGKAKQAAKAWLDRNRKRSTYTTGRVGRCVVECERR